MVERGRGRGTGGLLCLYVGRDGGFLMGRHALAWVQDGDCETDVAL